MSVREHSGRRPVGVQTIAFPSRVADVTREGLTAALAAYTLFTATYSGLYRLSGMMQCTTGGDAGVIIAPNAIFTDRVGAATVALNGTALSLAATGRQTYEIVFYASAGTLIQASTTLTGVRALSVHALDLALEQLQ